MHSLLASVGEAHGPVVFWILFAVAMAWVLAFKGVALWYAARNHQKRWFIALLVVNTFGILEIIYLVWFRADRSGTTPSLFNDVAAADHAEK